MRTKIFLNSLIALKCTGRERNPYLGRMPGKKLYVAYYYLPSQIFTVLRTKKTEHSMEQFPLL